MRYLVFTLFISVLVGCNSPDPEPHLKDRIYQDLVQRQGAAKAASEAAKKKIEDLEKQIDKALPQTGQIPQLKRQLFDATAAKDKADQMADYYTLKKHSREEDVKHRYMIAFNKKESFSTDAEYEQYAATEKLYSASRNWGDRVPKSSRSPASATKAQKPPAGGEGGE